MATQTSGLDCPRAREKLERPGAWPLSPWGSPGQGQQRGEALVCTAGEAERPLVPAH